MDIHSELKGAQLEVRESDYTHSANERGRIWFNKAVDKIAVSKNSEIHELFTYLDESSMISRLRDIIFPVGEAKLAMLTEAQFQADYSDKWREINGQTYAVVDYPELAARRPEWVSGLDIILPSGGDFLRINTGRDLGSFESDLFKSHNHGGGSHSHYVASSLGDAYGGQPEQVIGRSSGSSGETDYFLNTKSGAADFGRTSSTSTINTEGGSETRPRNIAINAFIKVKA